MRARELERAGEAVFVDLGPTLLAEHPSRDPVRFVLMKTVGDATNRLLMDRFVATDNGANNRQLVIDYLRRYGRPMAF